MAESLNLTYEEFKQLYADNNPTLIRRNKPPVKINRMIKVSDCMKNEETINAVLEYLWILKTYRCNYLFCEYLKEQGIDTMVLNYDSGNQYSEGEEDLMNKCLLAEHKWLPMHQKMAELYDLPKNEKWSDELKIKIDLFGNINYKTIYGR